MRAGLRALLAGLLVGVFAGGLVTGCDRGSKGTAADAPPGSPAVAESTAAASRTSAGDSLPDSLTAARPDTSGVGSAASQGGGFLAKLFGREQEEPEEEEAVPVELATVGYHDLPRYLGATATLEPQKEISVLARVAGPVVVLNVEEGDWVDAGATLLTIDDAEYRHRLKQAEAEAGLQQARFERLEQMSETDLAHYHYSAQEYEDARADLQAAEAARALAALELSYTDVRAPFSGQIAERLVDLGQTVTAGTVLFTLVDPDPLLAKIYLPEKDALRIRPGQEVAISPDTDPSRQVPGVVERIAPIVDRRTGTVKVTCTTAGAAADLLPGSFVRTRIETEMHRHVLAIPKRGLVQEGAETFVFKAVADSVVKVPVTTGVANHKMIAVINGLDEDDQIVTVGHGALKTGTKVRAIPPKPVTIADADSGRPESL